jgi:hypothetical protein
MRTDRHSDTLKQGTKVMCNGYEGAMTNPLFLELDDKLRWLLTGERCLVIPNETVDAGTLSLKWPSGERKAYPFSDPIWRYFELCERHHN